MFPLRGTPTLVLGKIWKIFGCKDCAKNMKRVFLPYQRIRFYTCTSKLKIKSQTEGAKRVCF